MKGAEPAHHRSTARRADLSSLARGGLVSFLGVVGHAAFGFLIVVVVTRGLPKSDVGVFFEAVAVFSILAGVALWGADIGLVRTIPRLRILGRRQDLPTVLEVSISPIVSVAVVLALAVFALAPWLARTLATGGEERLVELLRILCLLAPLAAATNATLAATRGFGSMAPTTLIDKIGRSAAQLVLVWGVVAAGLGVVAVAVAWAVPYLVTLAASAAWLLLLLRRSADGGEGAGGFGRVTRREMFVEFWRFTGPRGLAAVFSVIVLWLDTLLLGALRSTEEAGIYAAATRYLMFGSFASLAILQVAGPKLSELLSAGQHERARSVYATSTWWGMALAWPAYLSIIVFSPLLLSLLGTGFQAGRPALLILGLTMLVATACGPVDIVLLMAGKSAWNLANTALAVGLNIGLNLLLVPPLGIAGAAIAWSAAILANNLLPLAEVRYLLRLHPFGSGFLVVAAAALVSYGGLALLARSLLGPTLLAIIVSLAVGTALYVVVLWRYRRAVHLPALMDAVRSPRLRPSVPEQEATT